jgi:hypothetical protein
MADTVTYQPILILRGSKGDANVVPQKQKGVVHVNFKGGLYKINQEIDGEFELVCNLDGKLAKAIGDMGKGLFKGELHPTEATWTFGNKKDVIRGAGYAGISLRGLKAGGDEMWFADTMAITGGEGRYQDATGQVTSLGWTTVKGLPAPGTSFPFQMIHVFSVVLKSARADEPDGQGQGGGEENFPGHE